ncbi:sensor histidine kinase [Gorillibacterium timonense]|uniref:sensor histidine kinase n=1 Tax=Gorillibacterium timonense TaxID=1689269 RepID=UPI00071E2444|nr:sensor histidine kinase [Gorillibacterium timonense]
MSRKLPSVRVMCEELTCLTADDIPLVEQLASQLDTMADLAQGDVFIDCLGKDDQVAIVIAHGRSSWSPSLYQKNVVGAVALPVNEPGVFEVFRTGHPVTDARGLSQEDVPIRQRVVPIHGPSGSVIAVLIQEQDISEQVNRERCIASLKQSNAYLMEVLLEESLAMSGIPDLFEEGIVLVDHEGAIRYANERGRALLESNRAIVVNLSEQEEELRFGSRVYTRRLVKLERKGKLAANVVLLRDRTDVVDKERELRAKSIGLQEIRHRVENQMQTIISMLRLQQRRQQDPNVSAALEESLHRIEGVASIHRFLSKEGSGRVEAGRLISELLTEVSEAMLAPDHSLALQLEVSEVFMEAKPFASLALIVNELLQNTVKHRDGNGAITVIFREVEQIGELIWEERFLAPASTFVTGDIGDRDQSSSVEGTGSLGFTLIRLLAEETLEGKVWHELSPGMLSLTLTFPLKELELDGCSGDGCR